ncbi:MAG: hypothetical protein M1820_005062 [Bogoriella megaspora]|nr:MAG: hypothetical protein M1820_005062 [Bogoriella megaspora]
MLDCIYVVRHGFRSNWVVDPKTGEYANNIRSPTGIDGDPALASYGVKQSRELAIKLADVDPPIDIMYSSPFYRCLQTLGPFVTKVHADVVNVEPGLGEWFGTARFYHPQPLEAKSLVTHFPVVASSHTFDIKPERNGETIVQLHDRVARTMNAIISYCDALDSQPRALLICTHAAVMIALGRVLTGRMPEDVNEEDFRCGTCALSKFTRSRRDVKLDPSGSEWQEWSNGDGIGGGWDVELNGDCSHLEGGEERTW